uniref:Uncharacterized protein n=1 Tax=Oryza meridionalis TaxID=40149 RepID=A0A0E0D1J5_9ORYZ
MTAGSSQPGESWLGNSQAAAQGRLGREGLSASSPSSPWLPAWCLDPLLCSARRMEIGASSPVQPRLVLGARSGGDHEMGDFSFFCAEGKEGEDTRLN